MELLVYVHDLVLIGNNSQACVEFKNYLNNCSHIKVFEPLKYFLIIEVARNSQGLFLSQRKYALEIIDKCGFLGSMPLDFSMKINHKLALAQGPPLDGPTDYRR